MCSTEYIIEDGWVFNRDGKPLECKVCKCWEFYEYRGYERHPITLEGKKKLPVKGYQCKNCRKTVVQRFDFIGKSKQYAKDVQRVTLSGSIDDMNSTRHVSYRTCRDYDCHPSAATVRYWTNQFGDMAEVIFRTEVVPYMPGLCKKGTIHLDEIYTKRRGKTPSFTVAMTHIGYLCLGGHFSDTATADDVAAVLDKLDWMLLDPARFITDGSDIYPALLRERYPHAEHISCFFHKLRTISRWEKKLEKTKNRFERMKILRGIITRCKDLLHQIWDTPNGRATNNRIERFFKPIRRLFHQIVSFFSVDCANNFLDLVLFHWNFHKFERGQYKGKSPVEVLGFDTKGQDWLYFLGIPDRKSLRDSINSLSIGFSQLFAP